MGHGVQEHQWADVTCVALALCLCDQGKQGEGEVADLYGDGYREEAGEAGWMCGVSGASVLDLSFADVTQLDEGLVSVAVHGLV